MYLKIPDYYQPGGDSNPLSLLAALSPKTEKLLTVTILRGRFKI
jgi:hypothetical protein